ncbi:hypothetical protein PVK06_002322 [Gossypium arboreum]|uniref:Uncharacterized protein n=1 Tax=Gossypium arboreum TaxID=29729 RepID=A0ABR0R396_GOSAR|nr:hypothetical protein PVK06_002322 [Gossypium arboreum]
MLRSIDYWWIDCFQNNRRLDLALFMFNDITKVIGAFHHTGYKQDPRFGEWVKGGPLIA